MLCPVSSRSIVLDNSNSSPKVRDYMELDRLGLPTPPWTWTTTEDLKSALEDDSSYLRIPDEIIDCSGWVGLRLDKVGRERVYNSTHQVLECEYGNGVESQIDLARLDPKFLEPGHLVIFNSAFIRYEAHAVVRLEATGYGRTFNLVGEMAWPRIMPSFSMMLREAMDSHDPRIRPTTVAPGLPGGHPRLHALFLEPLRRALLAGCVIDRWVEASLVLAHGTPKIIVWGMR
jgi:hypothetical protein